MITLYDYLIIAFYLAFMLSLGMLFRGLNKNTSDYFRCGGSMPWWITGTSAWIASFSAWTFVGAAGEVYRNGYTVLPVFFAMVPALLIVLLYTCVKFRRLRLVTWMEGVRERFGPFTEQFYTWLKVPIQLFFCAMGLMAISVFMAAVFKTDVWKIQIVLGAVITLVAFTGGAFAVLASDFVQMFLVMTITLVTVLLVVQQPDIGGLTGLFTQVHEQHPQHLAWWTQFRFPIFMGYLIAFVWVKIGEQNNFENATMYLMPRSDKHARLMVVIPLVGSIVGPLIWTIPPLAASIMFTPDQLASFTEGRLKQPAEAAFVAVAMKVMPVGLLGLLLCAMFGATLTSMDAGVNKCVGVFVRSFYRPMIKPAASEKHLLYVGKATTLIFGVIIIAVSILVSASRRQDLFGFMNQVGISLAIPLWLPLLFGLFFKRTPQWSAWVTALVCFVFVAWANFSFKHQLADPNFLASIPPSVRDFLGQSDKPLTATERDYLLLIVTALGATLLGVLCFFGSAFFFHLSSPAHLDRIDKLFARLKTPVVAAHDASITDEPLYRLLGNLCLVYGAFVLLLIAIPNPLIGRLSFLFIGLVIGAGGLVLYLVAQRKRRNAARAHSTQPPAITIAPLTPATSPLVSSGESRQ